jgi:hypothetical protein
MPIFIACPTCGHVKNVPDAFDGRRIKCPKCGKAFAVSSQVVRPASANLSSSLPSGLVNHQDQKQADDSNTHSRTQGTPVFRWYEKDVAIVATGLVIMLVIVGTISLALAVNRYRSENETAGRAQAWRQAQEEEQRSQEEARKAEKESVREEQARREAAERDKAEQVRLETEKKRRDSEAWQRPLGENDRIVVDFFRYTGDEEAAERFDRQTREFRKRAEALGDKWDGLMSAGDAARYRMMMERDKAWNTWAIFTVSAKELVNDYQANEIAADNKYKGKWLKVSGIAKTVGHSLGQAYITLDTDERFAWKQVQCFFDKEDVAGMETVKTREPDGSYWTYRIVGQCDGMTFNVLLKHCTLQELKKVK